MSCPRTPRGTTLPLARKVNRVTRGLVSNANLCSMKGASVTSSTAVLDATAAAASAQSGSENFPVALRVLPRRPREELLRIYAYARFVDDIGDEAPGDRPALLDAVE